MSEALDNLIRQGALRWLHGIDLDPRSVTYGICDREFWAWKTKDFSNGTWQGGLAGFLDAADLLPLTKAQLENCVSATLSGTLHIQRHNGSFEEAYPYESSLAVTALVIFCLLYAYYRHGCLFTPRSEEMLHEITRRALPFLKNVPETHGTICNHLITIELAQALGRRLLAAGGREPVHIDVTDMQDPEGWFAEYGGADPGYQLLLNHYLSAFEQVNPLSPKSGQAFDKSIDFCQLATFPDGTFAGEIGARGTSICYPSGTFRERGNTFSRWFMQKHMNDLSCVTPTNVDPGNFVPIFNSWALARIKLSNDSSESAEGQAPSPHSWRILPGAKMLVAESSSSKVILSLDNGAMRHVEFCAEQKVWQDKSIVGFMKGEWTTQGREIHFVEGRNETELLIKLSSVHRQQRVNGVWQSVLLRALGIVTYVIPAAQRVLKKWLTAFVMGQSTQQRPTNITLRVSRQEDALSVSIENPDVWYPVRFGYQQHMASANTFQTRAL
ncbi:MAG: hypothetical protein R3C68_16705 [Myxococcota bacterium]